MLLKTANLGHYLLNTKSLQNIIITESEMTFIKRRIWSKVRFGHVWHHKKNTRKPTCLILFTNYKHWINSHILKSASMDIRQKVFALFEMSIKLIDHVKYEMSSQEEYILRNILATWGIPPPKLLIKDHKKTNDKWGFPTRLVIHATNLTAAVHIPGYLRTK